MENKYIRQTPSFTFYVLPVLLAVLYTLWVAGTIGFRFDHAFLIVICLIAYYAHTQSRRFVLAFTGFIFYWILYDSIRVYPNFMFQEVHIKAPYLLEKSLFGIRATDGQVLIPCEYLQQFIHPVWDIIGGICYINWLSIPLLLGAYWWWKDKDLFMRFSLVFLLANIISFIVYYAYPAAPPWYVAQYGFETHYGISGSAGGLIRFDEFFNVSVFKNMYELNPNIFGAIPSMHSAFPAIVLLYGLKSFRYLNILFLLHAIGIWITAVYSQHHYIIDVLAGIACALSAYFVIEHLFLKTKHGQRFLGFWKEYI